MDVKHVIMMIYLKNVHHGKYFKIVGHHYILISWDKRDGHHQMEFLVQLIVEV